MAYDEDLADRVRALLDGAATERRMFGGLAFLVDGSMCVATGADGLMVRVDPGDAPALLAQPGVEQVVMGARGPMTGWVRVATGALDDPALAVWVRRGVERARSLAVP